MTILPAPGTRTLPTVPPLGTWYGASWMAAVGAMVLARLLGGPTAQTLGLWSLAGSVLLFGLPHGAADWSIMGQAAGGRWNWRTQAASAGLYVLASVAALGLWWWRPGFALAGFLGLTAWHFGSADASLLLPERRTFRDPVWWGFAVGRGLLVVFTPLAFRPEAVAVLQPFTELGGRVPEVLGGLPHAALGLTWIGTLLQTATVCLDARQLAGPAGRRRLTVNLLETAGLLMLFCVAPPLLSFVAYWVGFHAWRHILRLESVDRPGHEARSVGRMLLDFHRRVLAVTLLSLPGIALILAVWPALANGPHALVVYLLLLSVLTVPHACVIGSLLDGKKAADEAGKSVGFV